MLMGSLMLSSQLLFQPLQGPSAASGAAVVQKHHKDADLAQNGSKAGDRDGPQPALTHRTDLS